MSKDLFATCNEAGAEEQQFEQQFCVRCSNKQCSRSQLPHLDSKWARRMDNQLQFMNSPILLPGEYEPKFLSPPIRAVENWNFRPPMFVDDTPPKVGQDVAAESQEPITTLPAFTFTTPSELNVSQQDGFVVDQGNKESPQDPWAIKERVMIKGKKIRM